MLTYVIAQALSPGQRIEAVGKHFATRTDSQGLLVIYATAMIAVLLCCGLVLLNRFQQAKQRREEQAREQRRRHLTTPGWSTTQPTGNLTPIQKRQATRQAAAGGGNPNTPRR